MAKYSAAELRTMLAKGQAMKNPAGDPSYPIADEDDLQSAIHAVGLGGASNNSIRKYIMGRAKSMGKTSMIPDTWQTDGSLGGGEGRAEILDVLPSFRTIPIDDVTVRAESDGSRTVRAYAAVFEHGYDIHDQDGEYKEILDRNVFNRALGLARQSGRQFPVLYNHGMTMHGTPDPEGSIPIGVAIDVTADGKGLLTETRFHNTERARNVLEGIDGKSITGYSFSGVFRKSDPVRKGRYRGETVRRLESTLREFGPALFPANPEASILRMMYLGQMPSLGTPPSGDGPASTDDDQAQRHLSRTTEPSERSTRTPREELQARRAQFIIKYGDKSA